MKETAKLSLSLAITCALAASVLAYANWKTEGPRRDAELRERQTSLKLVLPPFANDPLADAQAVGEITYYPARDADGKLLAIAGEGTSGKGFGGEVQTLVGLSPEGKILTVIVTQHKETPGLGTQATDRKRARMIWDFFSANKQADSAGLPPCKYLDRYTDKKAADIGGDSFRVVKSQEETGDSAVLAVSGATVSSLAVADAVRGICRTFVDNRDQLFVP